MNFDADFLKEMALLAEAEMRMQEIEENDNKILAAYSAADSTNAYYWDLQKADEEEEAKAGFQSTPLFRVLNWLAHQHDVPGDVNPLIKGMVSVHESKWSQSQKLSAWLLLRTKYADYLDAHSEYLRVRNVIWREIPSPALEKTVPKPDKAPVKEIILDGKSMGFIIHFRYLPKDEHDKVMRRVAALPGRQYFNGSSKSQRMPGEPHWYIPGDSVSAGALKAYLFEMNQQIADRADTRDYVRATYWNNRLETVAWDIKDGVTERIEFLMDKAKRMRAMSEAHAPSPEFKLHYDYKNIKDEHPRPFQIAGVEYILECTRESVLSSGLHGTGVYVGDPMGLGKSLECGIMATIEAWRGEMERKPDLKLSDLKVCIVCPASLKKNWFREFYFWLDKTATDLDLKPQIIRGNRAVQLWGNFILVNPELLRKEFNKEIGQWEPLPLYTVLLAQRWFAIVGDEGHMYKTWTAQRTANILELFSGKKFSSRSRSFTPFRLPIPLRIMMSGSPILNRPEEWASQLEALGLLEPLGGQHRYVANYCGKNVPAEKLKELSFKLKERGYLRREKVDMAEDPAGKVIPISNVPREILDPTWVDYSEWPATLERAGYRFLPGVLGQLPPKIRSVKTIPLSVKDRRDYMRAERDFINWLHDHYSEYDDADTRVAAAMRAQALVYIQKLKHLAAQYKVPGAVEWIKNFMEETETEKLVYYVHHLDIHEAIRKEFPTAAWIRGGQDADVRQAMVDEFQTNPNCRLIIITGGSGGVGLTLTAANHMAIMELPWGPAVVDQYEDRIWGRLNDIHGASIYYHVADYTIDTRIAAMIDRKREKVTAATSGTDVEERAMVRELLDDYYQMYGREDARSYEEILGITTGSENTDDEDDEDANDEG